MPFQDRDKGYTLLELLLVLGIAGTLAGIAVPQMLTALDEYRTAAAARYLATRIHRTRMEAIGRSAVVGIQFVQQGSTYTFAVYVDGNGDGIRSQDISDGVDLQIGATEYLSSNFSEVSFGVLPGLPAIDASSAAPGTDPIKFGAGNLLSYSPAGSSSSGTLYVRGRGESQYAVRVFGDTGRVRLLKFIQATRRWRAL
jgi:prepilin-type N-terminal cleavage/methylation domain-containing protein